MTTRCNYPSEVHYQGMIWSHIGGLWDQVNSMSLRIDPNSNHQRSWKSACSTLFPGCSRRETISVNLLACLREQANDLLKVHPGKSSRRTNIILTKAQNKRLLIAIRNGVPIFYPLARVEGQRAYSDSLPSPNPLLIDPHRLSNCSNILCS